MYGTTNYLKQKSKWFRLFVWSSVAIITFLICTKVLTILDENHFWNKEKRIFHNRSLKLVCYYNFPENESHLQPEGIPHNLCTHINVAFAGINQTDNSIYINPNYSQVFPRLLSLKQRNKDLKIIISVGGARNNDFGQMVKNHSNRKMFINSTMRFIKKYHLDGVDIDWEWPCQNGNEQEKIKFIQLLQEIRIEFDRHRKKYTLSAAVAATKFQIQIYYYVNYMAQYVDFINLMAYDYHFYTTYYPLTNHNAPLYASQKDMISSFKELNINFSVNYWITQSMPRDKIIMGLPNYGHTYMLISSLNHDLNAPASGFGAVGQNGFINYYEVCAFLNLLNTFSVRDKDSKVPYAYNQYDWVSYDDEDSFEVKTRYLINQKLGGAMVYSLNSDDFLGSCRKDKTKFPLTQKVKSILAGES